MQTTHVGPFSETSERTSLRRFMNAGRRRRGQAGPVIDAIETARPVRLSRLMELTRRTRTRFEPGPNPELAAMRAAIYEELGDHRDVAEWRWRVWSHGHDAPIRVGVDEAGDIVWQLPNGRWTWGLTAQDAAAQVRTFEPERYVEKYGRPRVDT